MDNKHAARIAVKHGRWKLVRKKARLPWQRQMLDFMTCFVGLCDCMKVHVSNMHSACWFLAYV